MIKQYVPKNIGKDYCEIIGSKQYSMFLSVVLGIKLCYDDWISIKDYQSFVQTCKRYNLHVEPDVICYEPPAKKEVIGRKTITTTYTAIKSFDTPVKEGRVHVFIAKDKLKAIEAKRFGWYPGIINNRIINKPFSDHLNFGKALGFPDCCINFFKKFNNWAVYSHPFETYKNSQNQFSYHCNNLLMDKTYFYIHHIPCSYNCKKTIEYAQLVESKISAVEPDFVKKTNEYLKRIYLVFGENHFIMFTSTIVNNKLTYSEVFYRSNYARIEEKINFLAEIKDSDTITIEKNQLNVHKDNKKQCNIKMKPNWFLINFKNGRTRTI